MEVLGACPRQNKFEGRPTAVSEGKNLILLRKCSLESQKGMHHWSSPWYLLLSLGIFPALCPGGVSSLVLGTYAALIFHDYPSSTINVCSFSPHRLKQYSKWQGWYLSGYLPFSFCSSLVVMSTVGLLDVFTEGI